MTFSNKTGISKLIQMAKVTLNLKLCNFSLAFYLKLSFFPMEIKNPEPVL